MWTYLRRGCGLETHQHAWQPRVSFRVWWEVKPASVLLHPKQASKKGFPRAATAFTQMTKGLLRLSALPTGTCDFDVPSPLLLI